MKNVHTTLHKALAYAVHPLGLIARNPVALVSPPGARRREMATWTAEQVGTFLRSLRGDRLEAAWVLALTTGMRRGELLGLQWSDLDLDAGRLSIQRALVLVGGRAEFSEPKTPKGRRSVPLPAATVAVLREHRRRQVQERLAMGPAYTGNMVFCREDGEPLSPRAFGDTFERLGKAAGVPRIRVHDCRHTYASIALRAGVPAKVVSEVLGHASTGITLDLYSHVAPSMLEESAATVAALIFPG